MAKTASKGATLLIALGIIAQANASHAQGQALRNPLLPRRDAATAEYGKPTLFSFLTAGSRGSGTAEQQVFVPLDNATGHLFAVVDRHGKPILTQAGAATKLSKAFTGGVTLVAPAAARPSITPGLRLQLQRAGITLKFAAPADTTGAVGIQGIVIKGLDLGALKAAVRAGIGSSNLRERTGAVNDADLAVSLERGRLFADVGAKHPLTRRGPTSEKARIGYGGRSWYVAGEAERRPGAEHLFTVSFATELERRTPTRRGK